jgi:hypothetical protein
MKVSKHWILFAAILILLLAAAAAAAVAAANRALLQARRAAAAAEAKVAAAKHRLGPAAQLQVPTADAAGSDLLQQQETQRTIQIDAEQDPILYTDDGAYYGGDWWDWWWPLNPYQWGGGGYYSGPFYGKRWGGGQGKWNWQEWADGRNGPQVRPGPPIGSGVAPI